MSELEKMIETNKQKILGLVKELKYEKINMPQIDIAYRRLSPGVSLQDLLDPESPEIDEPYIFDFVKRNGIIVDVVSKGEFDFSRYSVVFDIKSESIYHTSYRSDTKTIVPILEVHGNNLLPVYNVQIPDISCHLCFDKNDWVKYYEKIMNDLSSLKEKNFVELKKN